MLRNKRGSIINLTSIVGEKGQAGQSNYAASKAGIIGFTKSIADEFGSRSIRCNAVAPGFIETDMTQVLAEETKKAILAQIPLKRMGSAEEVANVVLFLSSDASTYVTGQVISVCGGMSR
jgi:3-oxoacyl-[acyl-carrier protein] reductase